MSDWHVRCPLTVTHVSTGVSNWGGYALCGALAILAHADAGNDAGMAAMLPLLVSPTWEEGIIDAMVGDSTISSLVPALHPRWPMHHLLAGLCAQNLSSSAHSHTHTHAHTRTLTRTHMHAHTHTHTRMYACTHTHTPHTLCWHAHISPFPTCTRPA